LTVNAITLHNTFNFINANTTVAGGSQVNAGAGGNITLAGPVTLGGASNTVGVSSGFDFTISGNISGTGQLTKTNTGALLLSGNNTFSGGVTVNATAGVNGNVGNLIVGSDTALGTGVLTLNGGTPPGRRPRLARRDQQRLPERRHNSTINAINPTTRFLFTGTIAAPQPDQGLHQPGHLRPHDERRPGDQLHERQRDHRRHLHLDAQWCRHQQHLLEPGARNARRQRPGRPAGPEQLHSRTGTPRRDRPRRCCISAASETGSTATITTVGGHGFQVGQSVAINGAGVSGYNGTFTVTAILSPTSFTYTNSNTGLGASSGGWVADSAATVSTLAIAFQNTSANANGAATPTVSINTANLTGTTAVVVIAPSIGTGTLAIGAPAFYTGTTTVNHGTLLLSGGGQLTQPGASINAVQTLTFGATNTGGLSSSTSTA